MRKSVYILLIISSIIAHCQNALSAQDQAITLEEALEIARSNYAGLERDRLAVERYDRLASTGIPAQPAQVFFSGDELNLDEQQGIHGFNVQQNFYLPGASRAQKAYYAKNAEVAQKQLDLTENALVWEVTKAYIQLLYVSEEQSLIETNSSLYQEFLDVASKRLEAGETGKIPLLAARTRLGQAKLEEEHAEERYQIALSLFNQWLNSDQPYLAEGTLSVPEEIDPDSVSTDNPHLAIYEARSEMAHSSIALQESKMLPQINTGAAVQSVLGDFPFFGYQIGINVPLFKKAYRSRVQAAEIQSREYEAALVTEKQKLSRMISDLTYRMEHQRHIVEYLDEDLEPLVKEQIEVNLKAYKEGEISYLEYLNSLEEDVALRRQYLQALYEFNLIRAELNYWSGR